jgi:phosphoribosylamine--glycine ligase
MQNMNPGIKKISDDFLIENVNNIVIIGEYAEDKQIDLAMVGPEAPLQAGVVDEFEKRAIPTASPITRAAEIETDKEFMRWLMKRHKIPGSLPSEAFSDVDKAARFVHQLEGKVAVKPIGLTGGKGVKVAGDHFADSREAISYIEEVIKNKIGGKSRVLVEEKAEGEEFTLQAFCDGATILPLPAVQDHKRLLPDDKGPNTGGMGSYSQSDGLLPFMDKSDYEEACTILQNIIEALDKEKRRYVGVIYGQFILTAQGPRIIEVNARWGDPEAMNVIPLLKSNFVEIGHAMVDGTLDALKLNIEKKATVCKYVVPEGYGTHPKADMPLTVNEPEIKQLKGELFYASVNERDGTTYTTTSRSLAILGIAQTIPQAEQICEQSLGHVQGPHLFIRHDIGTNTLIQKRIEHMKHIRG